MQHNMQKIKFKPCQKTRILLVVLLELKHEIDLAYFYRFVVKSRFL